ncbi:MAG: 16S rRNA (guanine(527)-N(7))-methyltransferase RsmG [Candidatus Omnitrophica bacterium]|nr:16S rRNA (guanine(527)-N(7))-methyltransferase RsmG [Candidatus Omnitrophota bacterium]
MIEPDSIEPFDYEQYKEYLRRRGIALPSCVEQSIGAYFSLLFQENQKINLTGYKTVADYVDFHLLDAVKMLEILDPFDRAAITDVGSGSGVPGILWKLLKNDLTVQLIESSEKKARFLHGAVKSLHLKSCSVVNRRAEEAAHEDRYREKSDFAVARALSSFSMALELTCGFVRKGGIIALPRGAEEKIYSDLPCIQILGSRLIKSEKYDLPERNRPFQMILLEKVENLPPKYPRKPGQMQKRPL